MGDSHPPRQRAGRRRGANLRPARRRGRGRLEPPLAYAEGARDGVAPPGDQPPSRLPHRRQPRAPATGGRRLWPRLPGSAERLRGGGAVIDLAGAQGDPGPSHHRPLSPAPPRRQRLRAHADERRPITVRGLSVVTATTVLTMRACVLREPGRPVTVETVTLEPPRADEVLVRIVAAGVCHSDVRLADGELGA